jgi:hypothetical protein
MKRASIIFIQLIVSASLWAQSQPKLYSVFIYSFAKSLRWPTPAGDNFVIGVFDDPLLKSELEKDLVSKQIGDRKIIVKNVTTQDDYADCSIIFLPKSRSSQLKVIVDKDPQSPILIISEKEGLTRLGSGINLLYSEGKLRFEYNLQSLEARGIKMPGNLKSMGNPVDN